MCKYVGDVPTKIIHCNFVHMKNYYIVKKKLYISIHMFVVHMYYFNTYVHIYVYVANYTILTFACHLIYMFNAHT